MICRTTPLRTSVRTLRTLAPLLLIVTAGLHTGCTAAQSRGALIGAAVGVGIVVASEAHRGHDRDRRHASRPVYVERGGHVDRRGHAHARRDNYREARRDDRRRSRYSY